MKIEILSDLSNEDLLAAVFTLVGDERDMTARLVAHLAEVEARELYVPAGFASLYIYCREGLGYSEDAAYNRKTAALVARRYPEIIDMLADGRLSLTAVRILAPVLNDDNHRAALVAAAGKPNSEVEKIAAWLDPKPDVASTIRKLPASPGTRAALSGRRSVADSVAESAVPEREGISDGAALDDPRCASSPTLAPPLPAGAGGKRPEIAPLAPGRYRVQFTIGEETERKLRRLQELLKREVPTADPAVIFDRALTLLLEKVETRKNGLTPKPRIPRSPGPRVAKAAPVGSKVGSRHMPAVVRRAVHRRDAAQCAFVAADGRRCTARAFIEYHHARVPYAHGGEATVENIKLHCSAHNAYMGTVVFGRRLPPEVSQARAAYEVEWSAVPEREPPRM